MTQIEQSLFHLLTEIAGRQIEPSSSTGSVIRDFGLDSLMSVQLMASLEERFGVVFGAAPEDMEALESLPRLARWVESRATKTP